MLDRRTRRTRSIQKSTNTTHSSAQPMFTTYYPIPQILSFPYFYSCATFLQHPDRILHFTLNLRVLHLHSPNIIITPSPCPAPPKSSHPEPPSLQTTHPLTPFFQFPHPNLTTATPLTTHTTKTNHPSSSRHRITCCHCHHSIPERSVIHHARFASSSVNTPKEVPERLSAIRFDLFPIRCVRWSCRRRFCADCRWELELKVWVCWVSFMFFGRGNGGATRS
ncbi:hypothetical protein EX30DRAFT_249717 [Ascodesmis nigricans]|uniref:Uncharacterized protein n=1 Tax=Ascodesmis nigricans TaxID=341454 RepID=A0A4S2MXY7_9PEZI|nr:hypothetical protein EX30DRAFT_249717 [Ascodesmis nigricans]